MRHQRRTMPDLRMRLVYSVRGPEDVIYSSELCEETVLAYTRVSPDGWKGHSGRINQDLIAAAVQDAAVAFVCGSNAFVETATDLLLAAGVDASQIRTERFGPT